MQRINRIGTAAAIMPLLWCLLFQLFVDPEGFPGGRVRLFWAAMTFPAVLLIIMTFLAGFLAAHAALLESRGRSAGEKIAQYRNDAPVIMVTLAFVAGGMAFGADMSPVLSLFVSPGILFFASRRLARAAKNGSIQAFFVRLFALYLGFLLGVEWFVQGRGLLSLVPPVVVALLTSLFSRETESSDP